jgi:tRNA-Thr(GGU) m(6)t(6)A37 methyltransferase TsaA
VFDITPIGYVKHKYPDDEVKRRRFVDAVVEILPECEEGLRGLEEFSHIIILAYLHKFRRRPLVVRPKRVEGAPEVGVFATDSPDRPNPIAVSIVRLIRREGRTLYRRRRSLRRDACPRHKGLLAEALSRIP